MNVYDVRTSPDWATLTLDWATFDQRYARGMLNEFSPQWIAETVWSVFSEEAGVYAENHVEATRPIPYYSTVFNVPLYGFTVGLGSEKQGIIVQLSGQWWNMVGSQSVMKKARIDRWKCTRWDEALTLLVHAPNRRPAYNIGEYYRGLEVQRDGDVLRWHHPRMYPGEETYYCGSRKSGRFARVYDKPELDYRDLQVVRVEVEYKRQWAEPMLDAWLDTGQIDLRLMGAFLLGDCKGDDHPSIDFAIKSRPERESAKPTPQPLANRPKWFYDQIAKAWMNWVNDDPSAAILWCLNMLDDATGMEYRHDAELHMLLQARAEEKLGL